MYWEKKKLIFSAENNHELMRTHAQLPTVYKLSDDLIRIYFNSRDEKSRSLPSYVEVKAKSPSEIVKVNNTPLLNLGNLGSFDEDGVMVTSVLEYMGKVYLYYTGWNKKNSVSYGLAIGLAISCDKGISFKKYSTGPIMDRSVYDPIFVAAPCVIVMNNVWKMWYISCTEWKVVHGKTEPVYLVKYAQSKDGIVWDTSDDVCIGYDYDGEALGRPWVIFEDGLYKMWFSTRGSVDYRKSQGQPYRIRYAESEDGLKWNKKSEILSLDKSNAGWDSEMVAYCSVYNIDNEKFMLYNGNGFGRSGFGYAELVK